MYDRMIVDHHDQEQQQLQQVDSKFKLTEI